MSKLRYLARSVAALGDSNSAKCPNCRGTGDVLARKALVTALRRCRSCKLQYRTPTDHSEDAAIFYNKAYSHGHATNLPTSDALARMKSDGFAGIGTNYAAFAQVLSDLGAKEGANVFDFGCSWGYGSYLLRQAGFRVKSYEISASRLQYGIDKLELDATHDFDLHVEDNPSTVDVFFSSHVLEHVPAPSRTIAQARRLLKPGGLFVCFVPNGSSSYRQANRGSWNGMWGEVHPNYIDDVYLAAEFADDPMLLGTSPVGITDEARAHLYSGHPGELRLGSLTGYELFCAARIGS